MGRDLLTNRTVIGVVAFVLLFLSGFAIHGHLGLYFNLAGFLIVVGGAAGAAYVAYGHERLTVVATVVLQSYRTEPKSPREIVEILVNLAVKSRFEGILSLENDEKETSIIFLREALGLLVDGFDGEAIRSYLASEMNFFKLRREAFEQVLRAIADFLPAFGLVGSIVGMIGMLAGVGNTTIILAAVPVALTSTLYGVVFANFLILPFAAKLRERTNRELLLQKIIIEGMVAIESEMNPRLLERKLKSFLTPASRRGRLVSLKKIQERFKIDLVPGGKAKGTAPAVQKG